MNKKVKLILNIIFWVVIVALLGIWLTDFILVQQEKKPVFCLSEKTHTFDDGKVEECIGFGYKVYNYDRESINIKTQFSPFFIGMKK